MMIEENGQFLFLSYFGKPAIVPISKTTFTAIHASKAIIKAYYKFF